MSALEERLLLLVQVRMHQAELAKAELAAIVGVAHATTTEAASRIALAFEQVQSILAPGTANQKTDADASLQQAREALAEELNRVYRVTPLSPADAKKLSKASATSSHPMLAQVGSRLLAQAAPPAPPARPRR